jgi:hypothetical protein
MSALVTEHFVLQSARSTTVSEAVGRASVYLTCVSSSLVAFGFFAAATHRLAPVVATVLPALLVLGAFTFVRMVETSVEIDTAGVEPGGLLGGDAEECLVVQLSAAQDGQPARCPGAHGDVLFAVGGAHGRVEDRAGADLDGGLPVDLDDQQAVQH